jgi:hypothetical protein
MVRMSARASLVGALALAAAALMPAARPALARGEDPCPEPNNTFQAACYLGAQSDALGFISGPSDTDAYRIEVLDFNVDVHVELAERPFPYRVELADWNGKVIASAANGVLDTTIGPPGAYYVFVDSPGGQSSDGQPYRLFRALTYPGSKIPDILYSDEFRHGAEPEEKVDTGAEYSSEGSKFTIKMLTPGTPEQASTAVSLWGPQLTDFTLTTDTRMESEGVAGYHVFFRASEDNSGQVGGYALIAVAQGGMVLGKFQSGEAIVLAMTMDAPLDLRGGVNRTVVRCAGDEISVWVNGKEVFHGRDGSYRGGRFGFGAVTNGAPPTVTFDNIIATTPTEG